MSLATIDAGACMFESLIPVLLLMMKATLMMFALCGLRGFRGFSDF